MRTPINRRRHADFDYCAHPLDIFVLLSFSLIFSFLYISYPPTPHSPLVISSCFTVFLLSLSPPLSPISLYKHPTPLANGPDVISFCVHSFTFYYPLYRYRTIPGAFICPLFGNASIPGPPAPVEFNDDSSGASRVLSTQQEDADLLLFPGVLASPRFVSACHVQSSAKQSYDPAFFSHTYISQPHTAIAITTLTDDRTDVRPARV